MSIIFISNLIFYYIATINGSRYTFFASIFEVKNIVTYLSQPILAISLMIDDISEALLLGVSWKESKFS